MENSAEVQSYLILILGTFGMLALATGIVTFIYLYQRKLIKRKIAYQEIENLLRHQELKSAYALLEGQDMERQRIAEDLHDNLGSVLVTLSMYAHTLNRTTSQEEKQLLIEKISDISRQAHDQVRKISHQLDSGALRHFGLQSAIKDLADAVIHSGAVSVDANVDLQKEIPTEMSLNIYRILQELINNTLKHAKATKITIDLSQISPACISMIYEDNGIGFSMLDSQKKGMGLRNVTARAEKLNAQLSFGDEGASGFSVSLEIPLT
jgi:two-component system, NarL family, sensor kinase